MCECVCLHYRDTGTVVLFAAWTSINDILNFIREGLSMCQIRCRQIKIMLLIKKKKKLKMPYFLAGKTGINNYGSLR